MLSQMARFYPCLWPSNIPSNDQVIYIYVTICMYTYVYICMYTYVYIYLYIYICHLFIYLSFNDLLGFFHILPIVNNATMGAYIF